MNRFNRDYALVRSGTGQVLVESHDLERLERIKSEYEAEDVQCEILKSDLPRSRAATPSHS